MVIFSLKFDFQIGWVCYSELLNIQLLLFIRDILSISEQAAVT